MKKILLALCALLLLTGCSDAYAKLTDGSSEVVSIGETTITKNDLYQVMLQQGAGYAAISKATRLILEKEVPVTDEIRAEADKSMETYKTTFGDSFNASLQSYGFKDEEDFYNNSLLINAQLVELTKKYVNENFDAMVTKYEPKEVVILTFDSEEKALAAKTELENGTDALSVGSTYESTSTGAARIVTTETDLDTNVKSFILDTTEKAISEPLAGSENESYYIVQITETDVNNIKDAVVTLFANMDTTSKESDLYYFQSYEFKIYDRNVYDNVETNYPDYLFK